MIYGAVRLILVWYGNFFNNKVIFISASLPNIGRFVYFSYKVCIVLQLNIRSESRFNFGHNNIRPKYRSSYFASSFAPSVWLPGFPARILSGFLSIRGYSYQEPCQDIARSWKVIQEIQDSYQEIQESRRPTRKSRDNFSECVGILKMYSQIFQDFSGFSRIILSGLLLKVVHLQFAWFCRKFRDAVRNFPGSFRISRDCFLKSWICNFPDFLGNFRMQSEIFQEFPGSFRISHDCFLKSRICNFPDFVGIFRMQSEFPGFFRIPQDCFL